MKRLLNLSIIAFVTGFILITVSCSDDFFDTPKGKRFSPDDYYHNNIDAPISILGCFGYMQDIASNMVLLDGLRSDMMDITENADADMIAIYKQTLSQDNSYINLEDFYKIIINVNEVLPNLPKLMEISVDFDSLRLVQQTGQLIALRAWSYFMLAKLNGEVGLVDENVREFDPSKIPVYLSKKEIVKKLIDELLPYDDEDDRYRFLIDHYALLGELYLEIKDYTNAAYYLKKCIDGEFILDNGMYMVDKSYEEDSWPFLFVSSYNQGPGISQESGELAGVGTIISVVGYSARDKQPNFLDDWTVTNYMVKPSNTIIDKFASQVQTNGDPGDLYRGDGVTYTISEDNTPYITKYVLDDGFPQSSDVIIYRPADIHLLLAEALNRSGESELALVLLNTGISQADSRPEGYNEWSKNVGVRGRVKLGQVTANSVTAIEDLIIDERAMELAYEGKRFFDLVRIAERRGKPAYLADKVAAKYTDPKLQKQIKTKLMKKTNWYIPLVKISK